MRLYIALLSLLVLSSCYKPKNDILDAFEKVNKSMEKAGGVVKDYNSQWFDKIDSAYAANPLLDNRYYYDRLKADSIGVAFVNYIDSLKSVISENVGQENDNISTPKKILIDDGEATILKSKINNTRIAFLNLLDEEVRKQIKSDLIANDNPNNTAIPWENEFFEHTPSAAVITLFEKFRNDALNTEAQVLKAIFNEAVSKSN